MGCCNNQEFDDIDSKPNDKMGFNKRNGLSPQLTFRVTCNNCGQTVSVDYNIAFIDGDNV